MEAEEAVRLGLVTRIYEDKGRLEEGLLETARVIASKSPVGIYTIKQVSKMLCRYVWRDVGMWVIRKVLLRQNRDVATRMDDMALINSVMLQTQDTV